MDATFSKIDRIDVDYLRRNPRVSIEDETKINADQKTADAFYAQKADGNNNFISEVFFLTVAAHHYGTEAAVTQQEQRKKNLKYMEKDVERFEAERARYSQVGFHVWERRRGRMVDSSCRTPDMLQGLRLSSKCSRPH